MYSDTLLRNIELMVSRLGSLQNEESHPDLARVALTMMSIDLVQIKDGLNDLVSSRHGTRVAEHDFHSIEETSRSLCTLTQILDSDPESHCIPNLLFQIREPLAVLSDLLVELKHTYNQEEQHKDRTDDEWEWTDLAGKEDIDSAQEAQPPSEGANPLEDPDSSEDAGSSDSSHSSSEETGPCECA